MSYRMSVGPSLTNTLSYDRVEYHRSANMKKKLILPALDQNSLLVRKVAFGVKCHRLKCLEALKHQSSPQTGSGSSQNF